eukprot:TRINITY_DN35980_c0_g1_i2.p4 TRINITY_DN35980_c0_g1~~TRINITY_DN35980_c0_g1_i2.p4  ORF type:complete len:111 (-),score=12.18 TRINITY_DN35980_c0_g1_i2:498-830(-)
MLYRLLTASFPFQRRNYNTDLQLYKAVKEANFTYPSGCQASEDVRELVKLMLNPNPDDRISIQQVMEHKWFKVDLPNDWNKDFTQDIVQKQQKLQSKEDIEKIISEVFEA